VPKSKYGLLTDTRGRYADTTVSPHVSKVARRIIVYCVQVAYSLLTAPRAWVMMVLQESRDVCCHSARGGDGVAGQRSSYACQRVLAQQ
jgi:hypothetical protein